MSSQKILNDRFPPALAPVTRAAEAAADLGAILGLARVALCRVQREVKGSTAEVAQRMSVHIVSLRQLEESLQQEMNRDIKLLLDHEGAERPSALGLLAAPRPRASAGKWRPSPKAAT